MHTSPPSSKSATIEDVARAAGVALSTVSGAFSGKKRMSEQTRATILQAAQELNYAPNPHAQRLGGGRAQNHIDLVSLRLDVGMDARKAQLIQRLLTERGYSAPLHAYGRSAGEAQIDQRGLLETLRRQKPRAIVCETTNLKPEVLDELKYFVTEGGLLVGYGYRALDLPGDQVIFDSRDGIFQSVHYLAELGHKRIGIGFPTQPQYTRPRRAVFEKTLLACGLSFEPSWVFHADAESGDADVEESGASMAEQWLKLSQRPSAIFITNDYAALSFMGELHRQGVEAPRDISIIGHDDRPLAQRAWVPLSSFTHPVEEVAQNVVEMLEARLDGHDLGEPRVKIVRGELRVRASSGPPSKRGGKNTKAA